MFEAPKQARGLWRSAGPIEAVAIGMVLGMAVGIDPAAAEEEDLVGVDVSAGPREEMVVTATRYPKQLDSIPANVSVITADEIENSVARNIPDLLRTQAGLHVTDITGNRASYTVDIRGFGETAALNTLVLVDGRRINSADLSGTDWTTMPLDRVERIEIIRGARSSVIYGDNASGGVINILTRQGQAFQAGVERGNASGIMCSCAPSRPLLFTASPELRECALADLCARWSR